LLLLLSSPLDALDGALARQTGRVTSFGAFLDSTFDRISDMAVFAGILFFFTSIQSHLPAGLALYSLVTAMMISYTKARAENLVPACGAGFARRPERIALLILGGFFHQMPLAIGWLALLNTLTFLRRMRQAWLQCRGDDSGRFTREAVFFADFGRGNTLYYCTWLVIFISLLIPSLF
jgi:CDP-diacylglycerol--glycerol-3-phosphate 3-phosphatidyltransferase